MLLAIAALAAVAVAARPIAALGQALGLRIDYPFDLEWMEGGQLVHAARLLEGQPIYRACQDGGFVPLPYPPLHFVVVAGLGALFGGVGYGLGRASSVLSLLALLAIVVREVWRAAPTRASREVLVLVAVASVAAGYPVVDGWYDLIRVDMLAAALLVAATALCASLSRDMPHPVRWGVVIGFVLTLAFFTKQTAAVYGPWLAMVVLLRQRRAAGAMIVSGALATGIALAALQWSSDGWYWTATVSALAKHDISGEAAWRAAARLWAFCPWACLIAPIAVGSWRMRWLRYRTVVWLGMFVFAVPQSIIATAKAAAHVNNLMMAVVLAGPTLCLCCADVYRGARGHGRWADVASLAAVALLIAFGAGWDHSWPRYLPTAVDRIRAENLHRMIAALDGDAIMPEHPFVPVMHGKRTAQPITQAYHDYGALRPDQFDAFACAQRIDAPWALLGVAPTPLMAGFIHRQYTMDRRVAGSPAMRSGYGTRPSVVLRRRPPEERLRTRVLHDFESGAFTGWTSSGDAFARGPLGRRRSVMGTGGKFFASSYHRQLGDGAKGKLVSSRFVIDRDVLALSVGGGVAGVHVELRVDGRRRFVAIGRNAPVMIPYQWDVSRFRGRRAQLIVVDDATGGWGHIHLDDVVLYDRP